LVQGGEDAKSMARLEQTLSWLTSIGAERSDPLVVAGGGTVGDVGGLAAALHHRGMPLVHVPTTWLAQADSSVGGKVAIDLPDAKNAVGAFWPAALIATDIDLLNTLPVDRRRDGLAECLKAGLISDPVLWELVEQRGTAALLATDPAAVYAITERAVLVKLAIVERDPTEKGERRVLNLGHTLGHALEAESNYTLAHGAAVALGLRAVAAIANGRGADPTLADRIDGVLNDLGFELRRSYDRSAVLAALRHDKKRARGRQRWILPMAVARVMEVDDVTEAEIELALNTIAA
jgi:3-dehydroquinate synthetase